MKIVLFGSTGSIGLQTLEVVDSLNKRGADIGISGLTTNKNIDLLSSQIIKYRPDTVVVMDGESAAKLSKTLARYKGYSVRTKILTGMEGLTELAACKAELMVNALVGYVGLAPTLAAIKSGKNIALANKETLVAAGELVMDEVKKHGVKLLPIDSEHSAIMQCIGGHPRENIRNIYLTASGGPFRLRKTLENVTVREALTHPNWKMGNKITIDSATMMNKGLEVIEAKWLFGVDASQIKVIVHPQSIVHSMVEFVDGAVIAQLGQPDMRIPIQYALTYPRREKNEFPALDFFDKNILTFERPDTARFKSLTLAYDAINSGGTMPAVMNAANEEAVKLFLDEKISFAGIADLVEKTMLAYKERIVHKYGIEDIYNADGWARECTAELIRR